MGFAQPAASAGTFRDTKRLRAGNYEENKNQICLIFWGQMIGNSSGRNSPHSFFPGEIVFFKLFQNSGKSLTDFSLPKKNRRLFPNIEPSIVPGSSVKADKQIRLAIVHLHQLLLGRFVKPDDPEVKRTFDLFAGIVSDAKSQKGLQPLESYSCQSGREVTPRDADPHYTIRAWRAVVTYLLRQHEFLYE